MPEWQVFQVGRVLKIAKSEPELRPLNKDAGAALSKATVGACMALQASCHSSGASHGTAHVPEWCLVSPQHQMHWYMLKCTGTVHRRAGPHGSGSLEEVWCQADRVWARW